MPKLDAEDRKKLPEKDFALPNKRSDTGGEGGYPIDTEARARNALARVSQNGSPSEKKEVREKVHEKFPNIKESKKADDISNIPTVNLQDLMRKFISQ